MRWTRKDLVGLRELSADEINFILANSGAKAVVTDCPGWEKLEKIRHRLPDLANVFLNVETKNAHRAARRRMKPQKRAQQRRLACAIGSEQTDGAARETPGQTVQDRPSR